MESPIARDDLLSLLARIDERFTDTVIHDLLILLRQEIGAQCEVPGRWIDGDILTFGSTGIVLSLSAVADGIPTLLLESEVIDLAHPVDVTIGGRVVHIDLVSAIRLAWPWLGPSWLQFQRVPWKRVR